MPSFIVRVMRLDRFEPNRIVTSNLVSPRTLGFIRAFEFIYVLVATISVWCTTDSAMNYFKYFTHLTYFGIMSYLLTSTLWCYFYLRQPESERAHWLKSGSPWLGYTHWLLYATVVTFSVIVPIVFWTLLADGMDEWTPLQIFQNVSEHALDGIFGAVVEVILNRHFLEPIHVIFVAFVMFLFMLWAFVTYAATAWDQGPIAAAYYFGVAAACLIFYFMLYFIHKYRNKWLAGSSIRINGDLDQEYEKQSESEKNTDGDYMEV
ncbi:hypothetical protein BGZ76_005240 [Entomortierella beljakovae]|nr:hypothetical protein BGZ76_005240 [Entomortierella beljakovae]